MTEQRRRTGNIRRTQPKRRYYTRRDEQAGERRKVGPEMENPHQMNERIEFRLRCTVTKDWKLLTEEGFPRSFASAEAAKHAGRFLGNWRVVRVTIRKVNAPREELEELRLIANLAKALLDCPKDTNWAHQMKLHNALAGRRNRLMSITGSAG